MKKFRIAICDDEPEIGAQVEGYLEQYMKEKEFEYEIDVYSSGVELCKELKDNEYDMLFLDIELPDMSGIEIGHYIREELNNQVIQIVYISAMTQYAMQLFEYHPLHFLGKPIAYESISDLMETYLKIIKYDNNLFSYTKWHEIYKVKLSDILYFEHHGRKVTITTLDRKDEFYDSMDRVYSEVQNKKFLYIQKSVIVNYKYIKEFHSDSVVMTDNMEFAISQPRRKEIRELHMKIMLEES